MGLNMDRMAEILLAFALGMAATAVSHYVLRLKNDNVIEQASESFIEQQTGYDIDFSEDE